MNQNQVEQAIKNYHWMVAEVKRLNEELESVNSKMTAQYGTESSMPKGGGITDSVANEVCKRERCQRSLSKFKKKVEFVDKSALTIEDDMELTVLNCLMDGLSISQIAHHMRLSERKIYGIKDDLVKQMAQNARNARFAD